MKNKGYTLIEILLVLALISMFLSMAVPNFTIYKNMKEKTELETLKKDLMFARNSAILESKDYYVDFEYSSNAYSIKSSQSKEIIKRVFFKHGTKLNNRTGDITFQFQRDGKVGNSNTVMFRDSKGKSRRLTLTPVSGKIRIY